MSGYDNPWRDPSALRASETTPATADADAEELRIAADLAQSVIEHGADADQIARASAAVANASSALARIQRALGRALDNAR